MPDSPIDQPTEQQQQDSSTKPCNESENKPETALENTSGSPSPDSPRSVKNDPAKSDENLHEEPREQTDTSEDVKEAPREDEVAVDLAVQDNSSSEAALSPSKEVVAEDE